MQRQLTVGLQWRNDEMLLSVTFVDSLSFSDELQLLL
jgi:hypothetical protein